MQANILKDDSYILRLHKLPYAPGLVTVIHTQNRVHLTFNQKKSKKKNHKKSEMKQTTVSVTEWYIQNDNNCSSSPIYIYAL